MQWSEPSKAGLLYQEKIYCVVPRNIHTSPLSSPMEGTFVLDPHPAGIFMQDACHTRLPPPGISVIFQLCWVPPGRIFPSKMPLHYTLMRKPVIVSTLKREKISIFMLMQCQVISNNNFFALQSDAICQTNELQLLPRAVARFFVTGGGGHYP